MWTLPVILLFFPAFYNFATLRRFIFYIVTDDRKI